jgi:hypothetical protein
MKEMRAIKPKAHTLKVFSVGESSGINSDKIYYAAEIFYWATFIGDIEIVNLFFIHLGFSPFINLFRGQSPVHAAALSGNGKLFEYLVKGSSHGFREVHIKGGNRRTRAKHSKGCPDLFQGREDPEKNRFMFLSEEVREIFEKSRQTTDSQGNNVLHYIFDIQEKTTQRRNFFLRLALDEQIGDLRGRNFENFLPVQVQHRQPVEDVPDSMLDYFPALLQENEEGDYMIITKKKNQKFITEQLRQLRLLKHTRYYFVKQSMPVHPTLLAQI